MPGKSPGLYVPFESKLHRAGPGRTGITAGTTIYTPAYRCDGIDLFPIAIALSRTAGTAADSHTAQIVFHQDKTVAGAQFYKSSPYDSSYSILLPFTASVDDYYWALKFPTFPGMMFCRIAFTTKSDSWDVDFYLPGGGGEWREPPAVGDPDGWGFDETDDDP